MRLAMHIQWHFDHNFYEGRQFTALINLVNRSADGKISASKLQYRSRRAKRWTSIRPRIRS